MKDIENELRGMFRDKEPDAPAVKPLTEYLGEAPSSRRRWQWVAVPAVVVATAAVVMAVAALSGNSGGEPETPLAGSPSSSPSNSADGRHGELTSGAGVSCVESYSPKAVAQRSFAFDGTVTNVGPGTTNREGEGQLRLSAVTFEVHEWFAGGTGATVTVDMMPPVEDGLMAEAGQSYGVGTRLLVSGEPRWGGSDPLADAIAWDMCGFTRYWDEQTAQAWRTSTDGTDAGRVVVLTSDLEGRWQAEVLFGEPVVQPQGLQSHPVDVTFGERSYGGGWFTNDGCNSTSGRFSISPSREFTADDVGTTLVACPTHPGEREHAANIDALKKADQARITTREDHSRQLTLLSDGQVIAVYFDGGSDLTP